MSEEKKPRTFWVYKKCIRDSNGELEDGVHKAIDWPPPKESQNWIEVIEVLPKPKTKFYAYLYSAQSEHEDEYFVAYFKTPRFTGHPDYIRTEHLDFGVEE